MATLEEAVTKAVDDNPQTEEKKVEETKVEKPAEKIIEDEEEEIEDDQSLGLNDVEQKQAKELFAALKDPQKAPVVLKFLAEQAGYIKTEKKAEEVKDEILSVLEEELGPEFSVISSRLAKGLSKIIDAKLEKSQADIRANLASAEENKIANEAEVTMVKLAKQYFDADELPKDVVNEMNKLSDRLPPAANTPVDEYITDLFATVAFKRGLSVKAATNKTERVARNRTDAPGRLASERAVSPKAGEQIPNITSLKDAISAAVEQADKELS